LKVALSIAGSDSGAGAGIQADVKTFSALGVYGCTAITAITAQNTRRVSKIFELPQSMVKEQITSVLRDFSPDAIKIGMVYSRETVETVSRVLAEEQIPIVLDPILFAGTGVSLLRNDALDSLVSKLLPICILVTPNRGEAEKLAGMSITNEALAVEAAKRIQKKGAKNVIVKGGHFTSQEVTDVLLDSRSDVVRITNPRVDIKESHGSGCNFSSAATAFIANGLCVEDACRRANDYVHNAITNAVRVGRGLPVTNPLSAIYKDAQRYRVLEELQRAVEEVSALSDFHSLIPETQTNFAYAMPEAAGVFDVAAVRGRIVRIGKAAVPASYIEFGASKHVASAVLAYMTVQPAVRSAINIRLDKKLVSACRSLFKVSSYDRQAEHVGIKRKEGATVGWGTRAALAKNPSAEVIYHMGDVGKEPMINVFGRTPGDVVEKIKKILKNYQ
jgi:hydroxymethylpyrimidine kinase / phosphomethylpyrimidine kinase / thiamine-phosphate diphosphorylase